MAPRLLTIAGSDSSGKAGLQADLATFAAHGARAVSVVTAVTAQGRVGVTAVHVVPPAVVAAQLAAILADGQVDAVKIGMLASAATVEVVARALASLGDVPVVLDPVLAATSGTELLAADALAALRSELLPRVSLLTPNLAEAQRLSGLPVGSDEELLVAARRLAGSGCAVLLKGGHGGGDELVDLLVSGDRVWRFAHRRQAGTHRGTGCRLAAAIAARLGRGEPLEVAVSGGIEWLQAAIAASPS